MTQGRRIVAAMATGFFAFAGALAIILTLDLVPRPWLKAAGGVLIALTIAIMVLQILGAL